MHILKDFIEPLTRIPEELTDLEGGETFAQILQSGDGQQVIIAVSRSAGTRQRPDQEEPVVDDVEGFGLVAEVMFPARQGGFLVSFGCIRIGSAGLIGAGVIDIGSERITPGREPAIILAVRCVTGAALFARLSGGTCTFPSRL